MIGHRTAALVLVLLVARVRRVGAGSRNRLRSRPHSSAAPGMGPSAVSRRELAILPHQANLNWQALYESQAAELEQKLGSLLPPDTIAVGHSNGGVVARQWSRNRDVGKPHHVGIAKSGRAVRRSPLRVVRLSRRLCQCHLPRRRRFQPSFATRTIGGGFQHDGRRNSRSASMS